MSTITVSKAPDGVTIKFGSDTLSSLVSLTDEEANWLIDELTNKVRGKRRTRVDKLSDADRRRNAAHVPRARQIYETIRLLGGNWMRVSHIARTSRLTDTNVRSQLHALKHAGYIESRIGDHRGGSGNRLVEWRIKPGVKYGG